MNQPDERVVLASSEINLIHAIFCEKEGEWILEQQVEGEEEWKVVAQFATPFAAMRHLCSTVYHWEV